MLLSSSLYCLKGQDINQLNEMVNESLIAYLKNIEEYEKTRRFAGDYFKNIHIVVDIYPLNFLFNDSLMKINANRVSLTNMAPFKKKLKKGVSVIMLDGITLTENQIRITFSSRYAKLKRGKDLHLSLSDWGNFIYEYCCEDKKWKLVEEKYGGV